MAAADLFGPNGILNIGGLARRRQQIPPMPAAGPPPAQVTPTPATPAQGFDIGGDVNNFVSSVMSNPMGAAGNVGSFTQALVQKALQYAQSLAGRGALPNTPPAAGGGGPTGPAAAQVGPPNVPNAHFDAGAKGLGGLGGQQVGTPPPASVPSGSVPAGSGAAPAVRPQSSAPQANSMFQNAIQQRVNSRINRAFTPGPNRVTAAKRARIAGL